MEIQKPVNKKMRTKLEQWATSWRRWLALLGRNSPNLSPAVICRLTAEWEGE
jgi:hypothetical protein